MGNEQGLPRAIRVRDEHLEAVRHAIDNELWALEEVEKFENSTDWFGRLMYSYFIDRAFREREKQIRAIGAAKSSQVAVAALIESEVRSIKSWVTTFRQLDAADDERFGSTCNCRHCKTNAKNERNKDDDGGDE